MSSLSGGGGSPNSYWNGLDGGLPGPDGRLRIGPGGGNSDDGRLDNASRNGLLVITGGLPVPDGGGGGLDNRSGNGLLQVAEGVQLGSRSTQRSEAVQLGSGSTQSTEDWSVQLPGVSEGSTQHGMGGQHGTSGQHGMGAALTPEPAKVTRAAKDRASANRYFIKGPSFCYADQYTSI